MDYQLKSQLNQTIYIASYETFDRQTGEIRQGDPVSHSARVVGKMKRVINKEGVEVVSKQQIVLEGPVSSDCSFVVWLPDDDSINWNQAHHPINVGNYPDEKGSHDFSEIYL